MDSDRLATAALEEVVHAEAETTEALVVLDGALTLAGLVLQNEHLEAQGVDRRPDAPTPVVRGQGVRFVHVVLHLQDRLPGDTVAEAFDLLVGIDQEEECLDGVAFVVELDGARNVFLDLTDLGIGGLIQEGKLFRNIHFHF